MAEGKTEIGSDASNSIKLQPPRRNESVLSRAVAIRSRSSRPLESR